MAPFRSPTVVGLVHTNKYMYQVPMSVVKKKRLEDPTTNETHTHIRVTKLCCMTGREFARPSLLLLRSLVS